MVTPRVKMKRKLRSAVSVALVAFAALLVVRHPATSSAADGSGAAPSESLRGTGADVGPRPGRGPGRMRDAVPAHTGDDNVDIMLAG